MFEVPRAAEAGVIMKKSNENGLLDSSDYGMDRPSNGMDRNGMDQLRQLAPQTPGQPVLSAVSGTIRPVIGKSAEGASVGSLSFEQTMRESCRKLNKVIEGCKEATIRGVGDLSEDEQKALNDAFDEALDKASEVFNKEMDVMLREYKKKAKKAEGFDEILKCVREEEGVENVVELLDKIDGERASWHRKSREWETERAQWHRLENEMQLRENETPLSRWHSINAEIQKPHGRLDNMAGYDTDFDDRNSGDMDGRWMNRLPAMSKYNGEKEDWDAFEQNFMIRYGQLKTSVALSLLHDFVCDKAKNALRGIPQSTKTSGLKAVMTWLRKKLSDETPFDNLEWENCLRRQTVENKTVGVVCEEIEKFTNKLYLDDERNKEKRRRSQLLLVYTENKHMHESLMSLYGENKSYEDMKRKLVEIEISRRNAREARQWGPNCSQINRDNGGDYGHRDEDYPTDEDDYWQPEEEEVCEDRCEVCNGFGHQGRNCATRRYNNWKFASMECYHCHGIGHSAKVCTTDIRTEDQYDDDYEDNCSQAGVRMVLLRDDVYGDKVEGPQDHQDHPKIPKPDDVMMKIDNGDKVEGSWPLSGIPKPDGSEYRDQSVENQSVFKTTGAFRRSKLRDQGERHGPRGSCVLNKPRLFTIVEGCESQGRKVPRNPSEWAEHVIESQQVLKVTEALFRSKFRDQAVEGLQVYPKIPRVLEDGGVRVSKVIVKNEDDTVFIKKVRPVSAIINGLQVEACLDTGSDVNLIDKRRLDQIIGVTVKDQDRLTLNDFKGDRVPLCGKVVLNVEIDIGKRSKVGFYATVMDLPMIVLGNAALEAMGLALCVQGDSNGQPASDYKDEPRPADLARTLVEERRGM